MDSGSCGAADDYEMVAALKELDAAKAFVRKQQAELDSAVRALVHNDQSHDCLHNFEAMTRAMNQASEHHRRGVEAFNVLCQTRAVAVDSLV